MYVNAGPTNTNQHRPTLSSAPVQHRDDNFRKLSDEIEEEAGSRKLEDRWKQKHGRFFSTSFFPPQFPSPLFLPLHRLFCSTERERVDAALKEQYFPWICITEGEYVYRIPNSILFWLIRLKFFSPPPSARNSVHRVQSKVHEEK